MYQDLCYERFGCLESRWKCVLESDIYFSVVGGCPAICIGFNKILEYAVKFFLLSRSIDVPKNLSLTGYSVEFTMTKILLKM